MKQSLIHSTMHLEYFGEVSIYIGIGIQVFTALIMGGLVGLDREKKMKAAGLKTNILICIGATLYTTISIIIAQNATAAVDPNRVGAQIVSGIGFLGAGAIMHEKGSISGLTTAATIWVVAAIGYTIGAGYPVSASIFSITVLIVLKLIGPLQKAFQSEKHNCFYHVEILGRGSIESTVTDIVDDQVDTIEDIFEEDAGDSKKILNIYFSAHPKKIDKIVDKIQSVIRVVKVSYHKMEKTKDE